MIFTRYYFPGLSSVFETVGTTIPDDAVQWGVDDRKGDEYPYNWTPEDETRGWKEYPRGTEPPSTRLTVGMLKARLEGLSDDTVVVTVAQSDNSFEGTYAVLATKARVGAFEQIQTALWIY